MRMSEVSACCARQYREYPWTAVVDSKAVVAVLLCSIAREPLEAGVSGAIYVINLVEASANFAKSNSLFDENQ